MNLADQLNQRFQKEGFPFTAEQNQECAVVKLPNGKTSDILINNIHDIDQTLELMGTIRDIKPDLLNTCIYLDDDGFILEGQNEAETPHNIKVYVADENRVRINNLTKVYDRLEFTKDDTLYIARAESARFKRVVSDDADAACNIESVMTDAQSHFNIQKDEVNRIHNEMNNPERSDFRNLSRGQSEFKRPKYQHAIEPDSLNKWAREQGLPLRYEERDVIPSGYGDPIVKIELLTTKGVKLNEYNTSQYGFDSQLVSDLNFLNQLYGENPNYVESAISISDNTVETQLNVDQFAKLEHAGGGEIQLYIYNHKREFDKKDKGYDYQSVITNVNTIVTTNTNLQSLNTDMGLTIAKSDDFTNNLVDRYHQIADTLLGNELSVEDLQIDTHALQM